MKERCGDLEPYCLVPSSNPCWCPSTSTPSRRDWFPLTIPHLPPLPISTQKLPTRTSTIVQEFCPGPHASSSLQEKAHQFLNISPDPQSRPHGQSSQYPHIAHRRDSGAHAGVVAHMRNSPRTRPLATRGVPNDRRRPRGVLQGGERRAPRVGEVSPGRENTQPWVSLMGLELSSQPSPRPSSG